MIVSGDLDCGLRLGLDVDRDLDRCISPGGDLDFWLAVIQGEPEATGLAKNCIVETGEVKISKLPMVPPVPEIGRSANQLRNTVHFILPFSFPPSSSVVKAAFSIKQT